MMNDESWRLEMRKTIEGCLVRLEEMMAQIRGRKDDVNGVKQEMKKMTISDDETHMDDFNPFMDETKAVDESKIIAEIENEVEKVSDQVVKLEPIIVGKTTTGETLHEPTDEDVSSESTKNATEANWSNKSQSKRDFTLTPRIWWLMGNYGIVKD